MESAVRRTTMRGRDRSATAHAYTDTTRAMSDSDLPTPAYISCRIPDGMNSDILNPKTAIVSAISGIHVRMLIGAWNMGPDISVS